MKLKRAKALVAVAFLLALAAGALVGCSTGELDSLLGGGGLSFVTTPKFLIATDYDSTGQNVNVYPINAADGTLGAFTAYDMGITEGMTIVVHPNGHWVYEADGNDGSIHQWDVNTTTGVPTDIAPKVFNEGGTFYQPNTPETTQVLAITPDGKYLIATNDDSMVTVFSIGSNGALTHVGDYDSGAAKTGSITTNGTYVWVTDTNDSCDGCDDADTYQVITMKIGSGGALTTVGSPVQLNANYWLWSIAVSPDSKFVQVGDEDNYMFAFTVNADGTLTAVGPSAGNYYGGSDSRNIAYRPDGKFFYVSDDDDYVHAGAQNADGTSTQTTNSPWDSGAGQIAMDLRGKFLYVGDYGVDLFTIDPTSGELTFVQYYNSNQGEANPTGIVRVAP